MQKILASLGGITMVALFALSTGADPSSAQTTDIASSASPTTTTAIAPSTDADLASTTSTSTSSSATSAAKTAKTAVQLIAAGPSRNQCLEPNFDDTGLAALQSAISKFNKVTHTSVTCISAYLNDAPTWSTWEHPWITSSQYGYTSWVAEARQHRQLVLAVSLIPVSLEDIKDPLGWEQSCADGNFNSYASELGTELVGAGLENSVIRLGPEMNGIWEDDFVGTTIQEQSLWATCFQNEATALRETPGQHFLIDWNPNACVEDVPYANFYPGNAYVDIMGLDLFDVGCLTPKTPLTFAQLAREPAGLLHFEDFATARGKPMSFPEWGLMLIPSGDNPGYINGIGATIAGRDVAFETYFDANLEIRPYLPLGTRTPLALAAFQKWFSNGS
jgi:hypothetical protein